MNSEIIQASKQGMEKDFKIHVAQITRWLVMRHRILQSTVGNSMGKEIGSTGDRCGEAKSALFLGRCAVLGS